MGEQTSHKILITGPPRSGKTTLLMKLADEIPHLNPVGFFTREITQSGRRKGFELIGLKGNRGTLAHVNFQTGHRVGKYRVDVGGFERFLKQIDWGSLIKSPVIIDEIGKMECFSLEFQMLIIRIINSRRLLISTIAEKGEGFISRIKHTPGILLIKLTPFNREKLLEELVDICENFSQNNPA